MLDDGTNDESPVRNTDQLVTLVNNLRELVDNEEIESSMQWRLNLSDAKAYAMTLASGKYYMNRYLAS